jgi:hypothetical protein
MATCFMFSGRTPVVSSAPMKHALLLASLLAAVTAPLAGCRRSLDEEAVRAFVDRADDATRKRYAPEICELRGEEFSLQLTYQALEEESPSEMEIDRKLFCREAGKFSRLRQYRLERRSLEIDVADDGKTANVVAEYTETLPYYGDAVMPATPDDFVDFVLVESHDESVVGIEGGNLVFTSAKISAAQTELVPKSELKLPYN